MDQTRNLENTARHRRNAVRRLGGLVAVAFVALFMFGASFGRADCVGAAVCETSGQMMIPCIAGNGMPCACACIVVAAVIDGGLPLAPKDRPLATRIVFAAGTTTEPEVPPPRI